MPDDTSETPVADTLALMTAASLASCRLSAREFMLVRLAAMAAVNAPPASYLMNTGAAVEAEVTLEDVQDVLVAVAPIVGTSRVVSATAGIAQALGFVIGALADEEARGA